MKLNPKEIILNKEKGLLVFTPHAAKSIAKELRHLAEESLDRETSVSCKLYNIGQNNIQGLTVQPYYSDRYEYQFNAQIGDVVMYKKKKHIIVGSEISCAGMSFVVYIVREGTSMFRRTKAIRDDDINALKLIC